MLKKLCFSLAFSLAATMGMAQQSAVKGRVLDSTGEPLVGVSVKVANSNIGAVTNIDGEFTLNDAAGRPLVLSFVGMKEVHVTGSNKFMTLAMEEDVNKLNDVLVTGYQQLSRERATGSFDKVGANQLAAHPGSDISSALQGLVAGLQSTEKEDGTVDFQIRGISTLYGDKQPLIVVDGFPIEGTFNSINPNDVESVTVLKDAAAASIWGARSANGVIVITTKKGSNKKVSVDFQSMLRIGFNPDIDYITNQADSRTYVEYEKLGYQSGWGIWPFYPTDGPATPDYRNDYFYGKALSLAQEYLAANKYLELSDKDMNAGLEKLAQTSNRKQLKDLMMQTPLLQQYNLNISGGTERMSNYLSVMYEKNDEATIKRGYERFMANYNTSYKFNKRITGTIAATWQKRNNNVTGVTVSEFGNINPYEMLLNPDGSYARMAGEFNKFDAERYDLSKFPYSNFDYNMLQDVRNRSYKTEDNKFRIQLGLNAKIIDGLTYDIKYQYENNRQDYRYLDGEETFEVRRMVNLHSDYHGDLGYKNGGYLPTGAKLRTGDTRNYNQVFRNQLTYNQTFGKHDVTVLGGIEMSEYVAKTQNNATVWGYDIRSNTAAIPYYGSAQYPNTFYDSQYFNINDFGLNSTYGERTDRYVSYYGNAGYMFDEKYGASFSIRSDGSNYVSKDKSLRWSPMWSAGLKWNIAKEDFMKNINAVNYLTLRATYGVNGNAEKSTSTQTLINVFADGVINGNTASIGSYGNPLLKWEKTYTTNIGVDFALFNNILTGKIDYYNRVSKDIVGNVSTSSFTGTQTARFNNAQILNRGIEIELGAHYTVPSIGLGINSTMTFSYNKNKIQKLYYPNIYCYEMLEGRFVEGAPLGAIYAYEYAGTIKVKDKDYPCVYDANHEKVPFKDTNLHNNELGDGVLKLMGTSISPYNIGWSNEFTWNGFSLNVLLTGKFGGVFRGPAPQTPSVGSNKVSLNKQTADILKSDGSTTPCCPPAGDNMNYFWNRYMDNLSCYVEKSDFIRLKELSLGYTLPSKISHYVNLSSVKFFVQMRDLGLIYKANKHGYDPEWLPGTNKPAGSITFGANIKL